MNSYKLLKLLLLDLYTTAAADSVDPSAIASEHKKCQYECDDGKHAGPYRLADSYASLGSARSEVESLNASAGAHNPIGHVDPDQLISHSARAHHEYVQHYQEYVD